MATYEYFCETHNVFEVQQKISDEPLTLCPHCQEQNIEMHVKKLISKGSFVLTGGGWANQGYSNK